MSVRRAVARPAGSGDLLDEAVSYEQSTALAESHKVALRMHDAFLAHPAGFTGEAREQALATFSPAQIVELAYKFFWWSSNRVTVTLGDDGPHDPDRVRSFHYTERGEYVVHE
jgi:hypothetical protein